MLIYLDTNIWVYAYENDARFGNSARQLFQSLRQGTHQLATSYFVLGELLVLPTRTMDSLTQTSYQRLFASPELLVLPYGFVACQAYAQIRASRRIRPLDALHLAAAASAKVDLFITEDVDLLAHSIPGIGRISDLNVAL